MYFVGGIVAHGHNINNAIHVNPFAIGVNIFEFNLNFACNVATLIQYNLGNVRISLPRPFALVKRSTDCLSTPNICPLCRFMACILPTHHEPSYALDLTLVAFLALSALVGYTRAYKHISLNINPRILNLNLYISSTKK